MSFSSLGLLVDEESSKCGRTRRLPVSVYRISCR